MLENSSVIAGRILSVAPAQVGPVTRLSRELGLPLPLAAGLAQAAGTDPGSATCLLEQWIRENLTRDPEGRVHGPKGELLPVQLSPRA